MIGLDSNVLVRFLTNDDPEQSAQAKQAMESLTVEEPGYVSLIALVETVWVLKHHYHISRDSILTTCEGLLNVPTLSFQCAEDIRRSIHTSRQYGIDLPDSLLSCLNLSAGCRSTLTFDRRATRLPDMTLIGLS